jgi:hypothetical protein
MSLVNLGSQQDPELYIWRSGAAKKNLLLALRISSGPALCNAGQYIQKRI